MYISLKVRKVFSLLFLWKLLDAITKEFVLSGNGYHLSSATFLRVVKFRSLLFLPKKDGLSCVATSVLRMRLLHAVAFSKKLPWLSHTKVISSKTKTHAVNARWKRLSQLSLIYFYSKMGESIAIFFNRIVKAFFEICCFWRFIFGPSHTRYFNILTYNIYNEKKYCNNLIIERQIFQWPTKVRSSTPWISVC